MIKKILEVLATVENDGWLIEDVVIESEELFFVKKALDMNRGKKVHNINVTIYRNSTSGGNSFKGSSRTKISPTMNTEEIKNALDVAALAASFVKNKYYDLVDPVDYTFSDESNEVDINKLVEAVYKYDTLEDGGINSSEFFVEKITRRILNSNGVDVSYDSQSCMIEIITDWKNDSDEVELHDILRFAFMDYDELSIKVKDMIEETRLRAVATPLKEHEGIPVVLSGENVRTMLNYFIMRANNQYIYEGYFNTELGENLQGEGEGDKLSVTLKSALNNSTSSAPCDTDGFILKDVEVIKDGLLKNHYGSLRYSSYLDRVPTGNFSNIEVEPGSMKLSELEKPHIELIAFSDFQTNALTGDFGGEIRLARYYDGEKYIPYYGGAITGNIRNIMGNLRLSEAVNQVNSFKGPKYISFEEYSLVSN